MIGRRGLRINAQELVNLLDILPDEDAQDSRWDALEMALVEVVEPVRAEIRRQALKILEEDKSPDAVTETEMLEFEDDDSVMADVDVLTQPAVLAAGVKAWVIVNRD